MLLRQISTMRGYIYSNNLVGNFVTANSFFLWNIHNEVLN